MTNSIYHESVMVREVLEALNLPEKPAHLHTRIIDATLGTGGHSLELIKHGSNVLGIDRDPEMLKIAQDRLEKACPTANLNVGGKCFKLVLGDFSNLKKIAAENQFLDADAIILDLGVSNLHLEDPKRGFSFSNPESKLDMRLDPSSQGVTAADLINGLRRDQLFSLFQETLDYTNAKSLTEKVILTRSEKRIETVGDFLEIVGKSIYLKKRLNLGTLPFLALRMAVNTELDNLREVLPQGIEILKSGGKLIVITFHSGEDQIVKHEFLKMQADGKVKIISKESIKASDEERASNPKSRSAKMRVAEKI